MPTETKEATETQEEFVLTDREKAIAAGEDPDTVDIDVTDEADDEATNDDDGGEVEEVGTEADADGGEDEGTEADDSQNWIDDSAIELAKSYGLQEEDLKNFDNESEWRRTAAMFEKMASASKKEESSEEKGDEPAKEEPKGDEQQQPETDDISLDPKEFEEEGYDDNTVKIVKAVAQQQQGLTKALEQFTKIAEKLQGIEQQLVGREAREESDRLSQAIDGLGGRFGSSESLTKEQEADRSKLLEAYELVSKVLKESGQELGTTSILRRAELVAFGDEILEQEKAKEREAYSQKVKRQSSKRRPVGRNTKPSANRKPPADAEDPVKAIANSPELKELWDSFQE